MSEENDIPDRFDEIVKTHVEKLTGIIEKHDIYDTKIQEVTKVLKKYKQQLSLVQKEKKDLESQNSVLKEEIEDLKIKLAEKNEAGYTTNEENNDLKIQITKYDELLTEFNSKIAIFENTIEKLKSDIDKKNEEEKQLKTQIVQLNSETEQYKIQIEQLKSTNKNNLAEIEKYKKQIKEMLSNTNMALDISKELENLTENLNTKENELKEKNILILEMKTQTSEQLSKLKIYSVDFNNNIDKMSRKMDENFSLLDSLTSDLNSFNFDSYEETDSEAESDKAESNEPASDDKITKLEQILKEVTNYDKTSLLKNKIIFIKKKTKEIIDMEIKIIKKEILKLLNDIVNINHNVNDNSENKEKLKGLIISFKNKFNCKNKKQANKNLICGIFDKLKEILE
jgi:uncharacterized small protein (DUF1192 family)